MLIIILVTFSLCTHCFSIQIKYLNTDSLLNQALFFVNTNYENIYVGNLNSANFSYLLSRDIPIY